MQVLRTVFTEVIQWMPHRSVHVEQGGAFYMDDNKIKVLSISQLNGVRSLSLACLKQRRLGELGWRLHSVQFRGVSERLAACNTFMFAFHLQWVQSKDPRHRVVLTYSVAEVGQCKPISNGSIPGTAAVETKAGTKAAELPPQSGAQQKKHLKN